MDSTVRTKITIREASSHTFSIDMGTEIDAHLVRDFNVLLLLLPILDGRVH